MDTPVEILKAAKTVLLIDWVSQATPRSLLTAGLLVYGSSPSGYSRAELSPTLPRDLGVHSLAPETPHQSGYLVFRKVESGPSAVDIVAVYRPSMELPGIISKQVKPLGAKALWLHSQFLSPEARQDLRRLAVTIVEGVDIGDVANGLASLPRS